MTALESFHPQSFPCFGHEATGYAVVGHHDKVGPDCNWTWHVGTTLGRFPHDVRLGDVAGTVGTNGLHEALGESAGHEEEVAVVYERGDVLLGRAVADPVLLSGVGIVTGDAKTTRKDQLIAPLYGSQQRGTVAACVVGAIRLPDRLAGYLVEGDKITGPVVVAVYDYLVIP